MNTYPLISQDIEISHMFPDKDIYCIGSREKDRYIYIPSAQANAVFEVLKYMDGTNSIQSIQMKMESKGKYKIDVEKVYQIAFSSGLIERVEKSDKRKAKDELELLMVNLKDFSLKRIYPIFNYMAKYRLIIVFVMILVDSFAIFLLMINDLNFPWDSVLSDIRAFFYLFIISSVSLLIHEFSHAYIGFCYGIKPKSFSVAIFAFSSLLFYIRLPGIYFLPKAKRIYTWSAGLFSNFFLVSFFLIIYIFSSGQLRLFSAIGIITNSMTIITNILPFYYSDGYYILSTLLETPNLRKKSLLQINKLFKSGINRETKIYWLYMIITVIVTATAIIFQIYVIVTSIMSKIQEGLGIFGILKSYSNLLLIFLLGFTNKIISVIKNRRDTKEELP